MIRSMTGFGKAEVSTSGKKITVEIRTLNSKQLDLSVKLPSKYRSYDPDIRALASKVLQRGKADIFINTEVVEGAAAGVSINKAIFGEYYRQLADAVSENGLDHLTDIMSAHMLSSVVRLPEVVSNNAEEISDEESAALLGAVSAALEHIDEFRVQEGAILIKDILQRVGRIHECITEIEPYEKERVDTVKARIMENIEKSGITVDANRFEQEMIFYMEKLDVTEEKVRLANHCKYFQDVVKEEESAGRKLGFISQEMGREINTLGSKANHAAIQRIVVGMKDELEKIKEQLLNIL